MSNYKSLIDEAMKTASYRLNSGLHKEASIANDDSLVKEASELANALEYMSLSAVDGEGLVGSARAEIIRDFYKSATAQRLGVKLAGDVGESTVSATGTQAIAPQSGKTKLTAKVDKHGNPLVTASPDSTGKTMLESYKQANTGTTLYDILMHEKQAGDVGEYDSEQYMSITGANENSNRRILDDASILSGVSKQEAKAPVRDRLRESFASTSDTLGDATTKAMFPTAYQYGGLKKTAMSPIEAYMLAKEAAYKTDKRFKHPVWVDDAPVQAPAVTSAGGSGGGKKPPTTRSTAALMPSSGGSGGGGKQPPARTGSGPSKSARKSTAKAYSEAIQKSKAADKATKFKLNNRYLVGGLLAGGALAGGGLYMHNRKKSMAKTAGDIPKMPAGLNFANSAESRRVRGEQSLPLATRQPTAVTKRKKAPLAKRKSGAIQVATSSAPKYKDAAPTATRSASRKSTVAAKKHSKYINARNALLLTGALGAGIGAKQYVHNRKKEYAKSKKQ